MAPSKSKGSGAKGEECPDICTTMKTHLASAVDHADKLLKSPELDPLRKLHAQHLKNILTLAETHIKAFRFMPKDADSLPRKR
jgi:hypothetical protein